MIQNSILIVGCGKMGTALVKGWLGNGLNILNIKIIEVNDHQKIKEEINNFDISIYQDITELSDDYIPDIIVFAIKPQIASNIVPLYSKFIQSGPLILSIMGGVSTILLKKYLGNDASVVRAMPNTPASIGKGISIIYSDNDIKGYQKEICQELLNAVGVSEWISIEEEMDAVTAISGSGPAYVFFLCEAMTNAGIELGLSRSLSEKLSRATISGSGALLSETINSANKLRTDVTSPGGTTEAAIEELKKNNLFKKLVLSAIKKAHDRSKELGK
jgi:pyrroline-5-carboxylate reductase